MAHDLREHDSMFSVRETPWHGLGKVLETYPTSIKEAIDAAGLGWKVRQGSVLVADGEGDPAHMLGIANAVADAYDRDGQVAPAQLEELLAAAKGSTAIRLADGYRANVREDTGDVLGIVSDDYKVVENEEAFKFMDALIASDLHFETAGSLGNGRRVWCLSRLPEYVEVSGDQLGTYLYVANSHDGSMAVTSAVTPVRIVCNNTLRYALSKGEGSTSVYKFRHTGDLQLKYDEARKVMGLAVNYEKRFKEVGDQLGQKRMSEPAMKKVTVQLFPIDTDEMGKIAIRNRRENRDAVMSFFKGEGPAGDTRGSAPGTKWCAVNAIAEFSDWSRRTTVKTDQMQRSFEDVGLKQRGFDLVVAA